MKYFVIMMGLLTFEATLSALYKVESWDGKWKRSEETKGYEKIFVSLYEKENRPNLGKGSRRLEKARFDYETSVLQDQGQAEIVWYEAKSKYYSNLAYQEERHRFRVQETFAQWLNHFWKTNTKSEQKFKEEVAVLKKEKAQLQKQTKALQKEVEDYKRKFPPPIDS